MDGGDYEYMDHSSNPDRGRDPSRDRGGQCPLARETASAKTSRAGAAIHSTDFLRSLDLHRYCARPFLRVVRCIRARTSGGQRAGKVPERVYRGILVAANLVAMRLLRQGGPARESHDGSLV